MKTDPNANWLDNAPMLKVRSIQRGFVKFDVEKRIHGNAPGFEMPYKLI